MASPRTTIQVPSAANNRKDLADTTCNTAAMMKLQSALTNSRSLSPIRNQTTSKHCPVPSSFANSIRLHRCLRWIVIMIAMAQSLNEPDVEKIFSDLNNGRAWDLFVIPLAPVPHQQRQYIHRRPTNTNQQCPPRLGTNPISSSCVNKNLLTYRSQSAMPQSLPRDVPKQPFTDPCCASEKHV